MSNSNLNTPICITQFFSCIKKLYNVEKMLVYFICEAIYYQDLLLPLDPLFTDVYRAVTIFVKKISNCWTEILAREIGCILIIPTTS